MSEAEESSFWNKFPLQVWSFKLWGSLAMMPFMISVTLVKMFTSKEKEYWAWKPFSSYYGNAFKRSPTHTLLLTAYLPSFDCTLLLPLSKFPLSFGLNLKDFPHNTFKYQKHHSFPVLYLITGKNWGSELISTPAADIV